MYAVPDRSINGRSKADKDPPGVIQLEMAKLRMSSSMKVTGSQTLCFKESRKCWGAEIKSTIKTRIGTNCQASPSNLTCGIEQVQGLRE